LSLVALVFSRLSFLLPTKIICCSDTAAKYHVDLGYSSQKMVMIPNGFAFDDEYHISLMISLLKKKHLQKSPSNQITILSVARFDMLKDHQNLIKAFVLFSRKCNAKLIMAGTHVTNDNEVLQRYICEAGLSDSQVSLLGELVGQDELNKYYDQADIFCLSSRSEGFPNVLFEAMARGCKIVSTDVGDAKKVFNAIGSFCEPQNSNSLFKALIDSKNKNITDEYQELCVGLLRSFSLSEMTRKYEKVYFESYLINRNQSIDN
jgi:glycosyltransferase involved in cell wall biosynthesis